MFPIMPEPLGDQGPPFPLTCTLYDDLLLPAGMNPNAWPSGGQSLCWSQSRGQIDADTSKRAMGCPVALRNIACM